MIGDFNLAEDDYGYDLIVDSDEKPLSDAYSQIYGKGPHEINTYNGFDPNYEGEKRKIDFIFISSDVNVSSCEIPMDTYEGADGKDHTFSDHYPVIAETTI